jgi:hypothetical protein
MAILRNNLGDTILGSAPKELLFVSKNSIGYNILATMKKANLQIKNTFDDKNKEKSKVYSANRNQNSEDLNAEFSNTIIVY